MTCITEVHIKSQLTGIHASGYVKFSYGNGLDPSVHSLLVNNKVHNYFLMANLMKILRHDLFLAIMYKYVFM